MGTDFFCKAESIMARMKEITFLRKTGIGHEILGFKSA
jgi:hypothetical protein